LIKKIKYALRSKYKCTICSDEIAIHYNPMKEWSIDGVLCGDCYSKKLSDFYPGEHARINKK
jgi:DNA-directed RNA polymerase subunit RPC12/RpoP